MVLATLLHVALVGLMGSAPPGAARPGEGAWGALSLVLAPALPLSSRRQAEAPAAAAVRVEQGAAAAPASADEVQAAPGETVVPQPQPAPTATATAEDMGAPQAQDDTPQGLDDPSAAPPRLSPPPAVQAADEVAQGLASLVAEPLPEVWPLNERVRPGLAPAPAEPAASAPRVSAPPALAQGLLAPPAQPVVVSAPRAPAVLPATLPDMAALPGPVPSAVRVATRLAPPQALAAASAAARPLALARPARPLDTPLAAPAPLPPLAPVSRRVTALVAPAPLEVLAKPLAPEPVAHLPGPGSLPEAVQASTRVPEAASAPVAARLDLAGGASAAAAQASAAPSSGAAARVGLDGGPSAAAVSAVPGAAPAQTAATGPARLNLSLPGAGLSAAQALPGVLPWVPRPPERKTPLGDAVEQSARPDCRTAYSGAGLLAVVPLLADAARDKGCRW